MAPRGLRARSVRDAAGSSRPPPARDRREGVAMMVARSQADFAHDGEFKGLARTCDHVKVRHGGPSLEHSGPGGRSPCGAISHAKPRPTIADYTSVTGVCRFSG